MAAQPVLLQQRYSNRPALAPAELAAAEPRLLLSWQKRPHEPRPERKSTREANTVPVHLYVFVHGFHGNSYDLRPLRNQIALLLPDKAGARFLCSSANEEHTATCSFKTLGSNLVKEVLAYLRTDNLATRLRKLSFVCHSFGGIICRSALAHDDFKDLLPKLHTLITLSGPHLGML